jgi:hypothetical protein
VIDPVYSALGRVLTISGRTLREEALDSPAAAQEAGAALDTFIALVAPAALQQAQALRQARGK